MSFYYNLWIFPVVFCVVAFLLLWVLASLKGNWLIKLLCILLTVGSAYTLIGGIDQILGNARQCRTEDLKGKQFFIFTVEIEAPDKIYFLVKKIGASDFTLVSIPYTKPLADQARSLKTQIASDGKAEIEVAEKGKGSGGEPSASGRRELVIYVHPPADKPDKRDTMSGGGAP